MEKGRIGNIEEKIFNTQFLGKLETGIANDGTSIPELLQNIRDELAEHLNGKFILRREYNPPKRKMVKAYNIQETVFAVIRIRPAPNEIQIKAECYDADREDAINMETALNEVMKKGICKSDGWGEWSNSSSIYDI